MSAHLRLELAQVANADDEEDADDRANLGCVKVRFADGLISDWLQVASPFAGPEYGMFALPREGTPALVAFATDDRTCGYVIGFLWSGKSKPPIADQAKQQQVWIVKDKNGNALTIDSEKNSISIESKGDLSINAEGKITIESKDALSIKAARTITIEGNEIDLNAQEG
ncbi:phage baseplate assembly protein V [Trinickia acidisoli]|uniref:phage baseplate assembly protein V n=1 Tax=Trinickia acidisoli TaxID=2767482 RepID=UPI001A8F1C92|nr:phage baseplate assembly protein V [Trinickia acidisoli]